MISPMRRMTDDIVSNEFEFVQNVVSVHIDVIFVGRQSDRKIIERIDCHEESLQQTENIEKNVAVILASVFLEGIDHVIDVNEHVKRGLGPVGMTVRFVFFVRVQKTFELIVDHRLSLIFSSNTTAGSSL